MDGQRLVQARCGDTASNQSSGERRKEPNPSFVVHEFVLIAVAAQEQRTDMQSSCGRTQCRGERIYLRIAEYMSAGKAFRVGE